MPRPTQWRVRVRIAIEGWVDVDAQSAPHAESEAAKVPGVLSVFAKSAMPSNELQAPQATRVEE